MPNNEVLLEALSVAPVNPLLGNDTITRYVADNMIRPWTQSNDFKNQYDELTSGLPENVIPAINLYLAITAIELTKLAPIFENQEEQFIARRDLEEAYAAQSLVHNLLRSRGEKEAYLNTWSYIYSFTEKARRGMEKNKPGLTNPIQPQEEEGRKGNVIKLKDHIGNLLLSAPETLGIRDVTDLYTQALAYAQKIGLENPPLWNMTLGDVNLTKEMEEEFADVPQVLGISGEKNWRIGQRNAAYLELMKRAGVNPTGYDSTALGWPGLIGRMENHLSSWGLEGYIGKYVEMGGTGAMHRAYLIAQEFARLKKGPDYAPAALFFNPGFTLMQKKADQLRIHTLQLKTSHKENFFPEEEELREFLENNPQVDMIVLTPINNPGSAVANGERIRKIYKALENFRERGREIVVINDLAYLGTGAEAENLELSKALNEYPLRIDVYPLTKVIGRPALRCAAGFTPDEELAVLFPSVARNDTLSLTYAMQAEAMAILDFVKLDDMARLAALYRSRQKKMLEVLELRPDIFDLKSTALEEIEEPDNTEGTNKAALYLSVPLQDGFDARDLIKAGIFATPYEAFFPDGQPPHAQRKFVRFALGVVPLKKETIAEMTQALQSI